MTESNPLQSTIFVTPRSAQEEVVLYLCGLMQSGHLAPGARIDSERSLSQQLNVSRSTLRDAISELRDRGYLESRRGYSGGTFVGSLRVPYQQWLLQMHEDKSTLEDIMCFRVAVESQASVLASMKRSREDLAVIKKAVDFGLSARDQRELRLADSQFHEAVGRASRSRRLSEAIESARAELFLGPSLERYSRGLGHAIASHEAVYEAIRDRDPVAAASAMKCHLDESLDLLRRQVRNAARRQARRVASAEEADRTGSPLGVNGCTDALPEDTEPAVGFS